MSTLTTGQAKAYYDRYGARQESQAYYEDAAFDALIAHGQFENADQVFEFGCGTGRLASRLLAHQLPDTARYTAVDISDTMVDLTTDRLRPWKDRTVISVSDGSADLPAADASMDRVVSTFVLDLLSARDTHILLEEAHRILKPGGRLCLASLDGGTSPVSRAIGQIWQMVYRLNPLRVGGCRPVDLPSYLASNSREIDHPASQTRRGISFSTLVAHPK